MKAYLASPRLPASSFSSGPFTGKCPAHYHMAVGGDVMLQDGAKVVLNVLEILLLTRRLFLCPSSVPWSYETSPWGVQPVLGPFTSSVFSLTSTCSTWWSTRWPLPQARLPLPSWARSAPCKQIQTLTHSYIRTDWRTLSWQLLYVVLNLSAVFRDHIRCNVWWIIWWRFTNWCVCVLWIIYLIHFHPQMHIWRILYEFSHLTHVQTLKKAWLNLLQRSQSHQSFSKRDVPPVPEASQSDWALVYTLYTPCMCPGHRPVCD